MSAAGNGVKLASSTEARKLLVERVASSKHVNRSARLRDMLLYVAGRVLDDQADEIHEQEVGHKVFGRAANYDTTSDNIVRVHASMLRKRLEQYFASAGADEPLILEIPKGNYAPVFRERNAQESLAATPPAEPQHTAPQPDWRLRVAIACAILFACSTAFLWMRAPKPIAAASAGTGPILRQFWAQLFPLDHSTDIVLDDAAVGLFQELTGKEVGLSEYFDRSYLRNLKEDDSSVIVHRHSSASSTALVWRITRIPGIDQSRANLRFARDYSFRELKSDNAILVGNARFNPWIEPFLPKLGIRWMFDKSKSAYYPVDTWGSFKGGQNSDGYVSIALVPNLGGTGAVLIISATGGSALGAGTEFLASDHYLTDLRSRLPAAGSAFPYFEALISVRGRGTPARDATIVLCRTPKT